MEMCFQVLFSRGNLTEALCRYISDTFSYMDTVKEFCYRHSKWMLERETEVSMMMDIKDRADKINLNFSHFTKSENKAQALFELTKSKLSLNADSRREELKKELATVLKNSLEGLEKLDSFLDAVERLAVTSLQVFMEENQVLELPQGISPERVQAVITAARLVCPLLLEFKRDASAFFLPSIHNVEVLAASLDKYICITQEICERLEKSAISGFSEKMVKETVADLTLDLSEDNIQAMLCHIRQLIDIRMDQHFRLVFLFQEMSCSKFISEFRERKPRMLQFLMKTGAKISSVAGSSMGAVGGVLSIVGLALAPVTAGVSLALIFTGVGLGVTSGVNSLVTAATETGINHKNKNKANELFQKFMEDVESLQACLEEVSSQAFTGIEVNKFDMALGVGKVLAKVGAVGKSIDSIVDAASAVIVKSDDPILTAGKVAGQQGKALRNIPRVASDIPDIGQAAARGPLALTKSARAGFITLNALFIGLDIFFICKDSRSLAKGSESDVSEFIRARAALWCSEVDSWQRIHDSLCQGLETSEKTKTILEMPFYPEEDEEKKVESFPVEKKPPLDQTPKENLTCIIQ
uniref:Apolipoprotein L n=1 Tax=Myripristis murdjan TaxID=586833 RepID=A0A667YRW5_9TELE